MGKVRPTSHVRLSVRHTASKPMHVQHSEAPILVNATSAGVGGNAPKGVWMAGQPDAAVVANACCPDFRTPDRLPAGLLF